MQQFHGINVDMSRDQLFDPLGMIRMKESYFKDGEVSPQERFAYVSKTFGSNQAHSQRLYGYSSKHWLSYSTPELSYGRNARGLPISCYLSRLTDSAAGLVDCLSEVNWLSIMGGGVGIHVGIRSADEKSTGVMPHLKVYDASSIAFKQGTTRRGSYAGFLDISHPDIIQFLEMRKSTGDQNMKTLNLNHGINIPDAFMEKIERAMEDPDFDDTWELKQPHTGEVVDTISAKELWTRVLEMRMQTGEPFLWFIDEANRGLPEYQRKAGLKNHGSNLCLAYDTVITIKQGNYHSNIKLGDFVSKFHDNPSETFEVKSLDVKTGKVRWATVTAAAQTGTTNELYVIATKDSSFAIQCTADHLIWTDAGMFKRARDLGPSDKVLIEDTNKWEYVTIVKKQTDNVAVYDITVPDTETFFANHVLVHNCTEISLATNELRTAVCCLASLNLEYYDDWKDDQLFIRDVIEMLDNVIQHFIDNAPDTISRAILSAQRERSVGVGALGFHAYLQKNHIPFESALAKSFNKRVFANIRKELDIANEQLAQERGACPDAADYGIMKRCSHVMAIAPNASSSIIMGNTSPSVEPYAANAYRQDTTSGAYLNKNRFLDAIIVTESKKHRDGWYDETWASITSNNGSVQHLDWMDDYTKLVYKTAIEIDQLWIVEHAVDRQPHIDQAQSINMYFRPDVNIKYLHMCHLKAYQGKLKSLYYCRSTKLRQADQVGRRIERHKIEDEADTVSNIKSDGCLACE